MHAFIRSSPYSNLLLFPLFLPLAAATACCCTFCCMLVLAAVCCSFTTVAWCCCCACCLKSCPHVWFPRRRLFFIVCLSPWQEYGGGSEESKATELALRGRILDQAQRFLLALVVHDPSRRATCAEEASRHGLSLGGERRQWLFNALTASASVSTTTAPTADGIADRAGEGAEEEALGGALAPASASAHAPSDDAVLAVLSSAADGWSGPSAEALAAGGDVLFEEVRAAAPGGYFGLRGVAEGMAESGVSWNGEGEEEETLDWAFEKAEADRVARGTNTDLVLLEVVMVMLKEQVKGLFR